MSNIIDQIEKENMKENVGQFNIGDTVRVGVKIKEGDKERIQAFEGVVIARKNGGIRETFTVRKISNGVGVERTFPLHSPLVASVEVVRKVRQEEQNSTMLEILLVKLQKSNLLTTNKNYHNFSHLLLKLAEY